MFIDKKSLCTKNDDKGGKYLSLQNFTVQLPTRRPLSTCNFQNLCDRPSLTLVSPQSFSAPNRKHAAFSIVEMLMVLLVASLLLAALAPVMTRKFTENLSISGVGGGIIPKTYCAYVNNGNDPILKTTKGEGCLVPDNTYTANAIIASGGGGGGGAADMVLSSVKTLISNINNSAETSAQSAAFDKWTKEMTIELVGAGGGGGGGNNTNIIGEPEAQVDCEPFGVYVNKTQNGGKAVCVSKYNPGENRDGSPPTAGVTGVTSVPIGTQCNFTSTNECCWYGNNNGIHQTASSGCNSASGNYSGCYRTVCSMKAGDKICKAWHPVAPGYAGRLPYYSELTSWAPYINNNGVLNKYQSVEQPGLQLCGRDNKSGYTYCLYKGNACPNSGGLNSNCHVDRLWSSTQIGSTDKYYDMLLYNGSFAHEANYVQTLISSIRCVSEVGNVFTPHTGGGGSAGVYASVKVPDSVLSRATESGNATIKSYSGRPGAGGGGKATTEAGTGGVSGVEIYDTNGTLVWKVNTPGGKGGYGATATLGGNANVETTANCTYLDITDKNYQTEKEIPCSKIATAYHSGIEGVDGSADADFGAGGESWWGGKKSNKTSAGSPGSTPGAGGGGSTCIRNEKDFANPICYDGGNGGGGAVLVTYKTSYPGAGGGGGGAGAVLHVKNFQVRPGDLIKAQIGHGGNGGSADENGTSGGASYIEQTRNDETVAKYEVLGGNGGGAGISGKFSPSLTAPSAGAGGLGGKIADSTKSRLNPNNSEYYPKNPDEAKGSDAPTYQYGASAGGNGGINPKISFLASTDGTLNGKPCGGLNTDEISLKTTPGGALGDSDEAKWQCNNTSHVPLALTRALTEHSPFTAETISTFAAGSTGGGGGGWKYGETPTVSGGAKGLGGYVYIYFGEWGE